MPFGAKDVFADFVVGACNRDADRAVHRLLGELTGASAPARGSAVLIHGRSGVGKTMLLTALAEVAADAGHEVHHCQAAEFVERLLIRIRQGAGPDEIARCRGLVLVDGLEALAEMPETEAEFVHMVGEAMRNGASFVGAESASAPAVASRLAARLDDRGILAQMARIAELDPRSRRLVLKRCLRRRELRLPRRALARLTSLPLRSGAEVQGLATRLEACLELGGPRAVEALIHQELWGHRDLGRSSG